MFMTIGFHRFFDFLPIIDLGKLWSFFRLKQPSRPLNDQERAERFHYITWDGADPMRPDDLLGGRVYITPHDRAVLWDASNDKCAQEAQYLKKSPAELFPSKRNSRAAALNDTRDVVDVISLEDRKQMLRDYYGEQKAKLICKKAFG